MERVTTDHTEIINQVRGFSMDEVKQTIEYKKNELVSEVRENMTFIKIVQDEMNNLKTKLTQL